MAIEERVLPELYAGCQVKFVPQHAFGLDDPECQEGFLAGLIEGEADWWLVYFWEPGTEVIQPQPMAVPFTQIIKHYSRAAWLVKDFLDKHGLKKYRLAGGSTRGGAVVTIQA